MTTGKWIGLACVAAVGAVIYYKREAIMKTTIAALSSAAETWDQAEKEMRERKQKKLEK